MVTKTTETNTLFFPPYPVENFMPFGRFFFRLRSILHPNRSLIFISAIDVNIPYKDDNLYSFRYKRVFLVNNDVFMLTPESIEGISHFVFTSSKSSNLWKILRNRLEISFPKYFLAEVRRILS